MSYAFHASTQLRLFHLFLNTIPSVTNTPLEYVNLCEDRSDNCGEFFSLCNVSLTFSKYYCEKTCDICDKKALPEENMCVDYDDNCNKLIPFCDKDLILAKHWCPKTCDICNTRGLFEADTCEDRESDCNKFLSLCGKIPGLAKYWCKRTCRMCDVTVVGPPEADMCEDHTDVCNDFLPFCGEYPSFAKYWCPKTCSICDRANTCNNRMDSCDVFFTLCGKNSIFTEYFCPETCDFCDAGVGCEAGWTRYKKQYCFKTVHVATNYNDARLTCRTYSAHLAIIDQQEIGSFIHNLYNRNGDAPYWIGLKKVKGEWIWTDNRNYYPEYTNWEDNQPDKCCGKIAKNPEGSWDDYDCNATAIHGSAIGFVCQRELKIINSEAETKIYHPRVTQKSQK